MDSLITTYTETGFLHHVYLIEGNREDVRALLLTFITDHLNQPIQANPDFWHNQFVSFAIDDARDLRERQSNKSFSNNKKIFIIEADLITVEAQNALLKIFEEPTPNTHFFLLMPTRELLMPTVRSRLMIVSHREQKDAGALAKTFLEAGPAERIKLVAPIIEEKDRAAAMRLVDGAIQELHSKKKPQGAPQLQELLKCRSFLNDRSPSLKLILEHISLVL